MTSRTCSEGGGHEATQHTRAHPLRLGAFTVGPGRGADPDAVGPGSQNIQARYGHCSPPKQNGSDHNTSFFVWHKRGGPFYSVHLINTGMAEHKATYFARGVDPPGDPEVSNTLPISEDELKWLQEWWPKTRLHDMPTI
jgi:hypothetical protein